MTDTKPDYAQRVAIGYDSSNKENVTAIVRFSDRLVSPDGMLSEPISVINTTDPATVGHRHRHWEMELELDTDNTTAFEGTQVTSGAAASRALRQGADNGAIGYFVVNFYDTGATLRSYTYESGRTYVTNVRGRTNNERGTERNTTVYKLICRGNRTTGTAAISGSAATNDKTHTGIAGVAAQRAIITGSYTEAAIDVDAGSTTGTITADGGTPFSIFSAGDLIYVTGAEQDATDGFYTLSAATNTVLTTNTLLGGTDNATDTALVIHLISRNVLAVEAEFVGGGGGDILDVRFTPNTYEGVGVTEWPGKYWKMMVDFDGYTDIFDSYLNDDGVNTTVPGFSVIYDLTGGNIALHQYEASQVWTSNWDGAGMRERGERQPTRIEFVCIGTRTVTYPS